MSKSLNPLTNPLFAAVYPVGGGNRNYTFKLKGDSVPRITLQTATFWLRFIGTESRRKIQNSFLEIGGLMTILYKERLSDVIEVLFDSISGYYEVYKNSKLISAVQDLIDAQAVYNVI